MNVIDQKEGAGWMAYHGDCVEVVSGLPTASVGYSIFSPPFASLYTYSASSRDMGNCESHDEFYKHFRFLVGELLRVTKPGRLLSFHCMNLPTLKSRDGYIGISDFRGLLIKMFQEAGWIYHSEVCIWKDPVTAMQRTKALGLLHKTIRKDSSMSRQGISDWLITLLKPTDERGEPLLPQVYPTDLVTMRAPGENPEPIAHNGKAIALVDADDEEIQTVTTAEFPVELWQRYASPIWVVAGEARDGFKVVTEDIRPGDTLQHRSAREDADERHIAPLQLEVIRRGIRLWSNPGDVVLTPFGGIGSEGYVALQEGRKAVLVELKRTYWEQQCRNLSTAEPNASGRQTDLFALLDAPATPTEPAPPVDDRPSFGTFSLEPTPVEAPPKRKRASKSAATEATK